MWVVASLPFAAVAKSETSSPRHRTPHLAPDKVTGAPLTAKSPGLESLAIRIHAAGPEELSPLKVVINPPGPINSRPEASALPRPPSHFRRIVCFLQQGTCGHKAHVSDYVAPEMRPFPITSGKTCTAPG